MTRLLATYSLYGELHRVELVRLRDGALLLDRPAESAPLLVAELSREEGEDQALAVLETGGYLERARAGERGLCRSLRRDDRRPGERDLARAA
jgi:hypothetical protein